MLLLSLAFFSSCTNEEKPVALAKNSSAVLLKNLSNYNDLTVGNLYQSKCSGWLDCLGSVVVVAGADILGAATGVVAVKEAALILGATTGGTGGVALVVGAGVVVGAGASVAAAQTIKSSKDLGGDIRFGNLTINLPNEFQYLSEVGIEHNMVINDIFNNRPINVYYDYKKFSEQQMDVLDSEILAESIAKINTISTNYGVNEFNYLKLNDDMFEAGFLTKNMKDVLDLFMKEYTSILDDDDIENVVNFYINEVAKSNLNETEKQGLIAAFMVASQSPYYLLK